MQQLFFFFKPVQQLGPSISRWHHQVAPSGPCLIWKTTLSQQHFCLWATGQPCTPSYAQSFTSQLDRQPPTKWHLGETWPHGRCMGQCPHVLIWHAQLVCTCCMMKPHNVGHCHVWACVWLVWGGQQEVQRQEVRGFPLFPAHSCCLMSPLR